MKTPICIASALAAVLLPLAGSAAGLEDLVTNPDDVMLRKPAPKAAPAATAPKADAEQAARAEAARKAAQEQARAEAARKAAEAEAEKKAAEAQARAEAEKKATEEKLRREAEMKRLREQVAAEQKARADAEAARKAAETQAAAEKKAAEEAVAKAEKAKTAAEKRAAYLRNPDPDERPAPKKLQPQGEQQDVTETMPSAEEAKPVAEKKPAAKKGKGDKKTTGRAATVRAGRTDYDRKNGVILFDRSVFVDDEQYQMHAERMFVFLDGTNDLKRLVALGNVAITNETRSAGCARAVFMKADSCIVLFGDEKEPAWLSEAGGKKGDASTVRGTRITYWVDTDMATVEDTVVTMPGFSGGAKDFVGGVMAEPGKKKQKE